MTSAAAACFCKTVIRMVLEHSPDPVRIDPPHKQHTSALVQLKTVAWVCAAPSLAEWQHENSGRSRNGRTSSKL